MCARCTLLCGQRTAAIPNPKSQRRSMTNHGGTKNTECSLGLLCALHVSVARATNWIFRIWGSGILGFAYRAAKNDGNGMSRMVRNPGAAVNTCGIAFTVIDAVAISPWMPPCTFE